MPSTSIRIDEHALAVLRELAQKQRQPLQTVLNEAIALVWLVSGAEY